MLLARPCITYSTLRVAARLVIKLAERILEQVILDHSKGVKGVTGAILVFLPGLRDIRGLHDILSTGRGRFRGSDLDPAEAEVAQQCLFPLMLHSTVPPRDQAKVFQRPPRGLVKVVLSTNIAETSITIDDVVCVVDTMRVNATGFDPVNGIACLKEQWCSRAAHRQRAGRAGRVRAGECWSLVTSKRHGACAAFEQPEIFRVPLDQLYLRIEAALAARPASAPKSAQASAHAVLKRFMDAPADSAILSAVESLKDVGAIDGASGRGRGGRFHAPLYTLLVVLHTIHAGGWMTPPPMARQAQADFARPPPRLHPGRPPAGQGAALRRDFPLR
jgi:ATP-dependent RNA helicase DHX36